MRKPWLVCFALVAALSLTGLSGCAKKDEEPDFSGYTKIAELATVELMKNDKLKVALDLNKLWEDSMDDGSKLVTGVVIANNEFVQDHADKVNDFMDAYKESVDFVNSDTEAAAQIIGDHDIIAKEVAQKAIPDCSIVFIEGDEMKTMLSGYLATLDDQNPEIIGGQLPDDAFYYKR